MSKEIKAPILCCPHCGQKLARVDGVGRPSALECSCGYIWYLGEKLKINRQEGEEQNPTEYTFVTPAHKIRIKEFAEMGLTSTEAANALGIRNGTVSNYYKRYGFSKKQKLITDEQTLKVIELSASKEKMTQRKIGREVGLSVASVSKIQNENRRIIDERKTK